MTLATPEYTSDQPTRVPAPPTTGPATDAEPRTAIDWQLLYKQWMARLFANIFLALAVILSLYSLYHLVADLLASQRGVIPVVVGAINTLVIALAMFELGAGISKEYTGGDDQDNVYIDIRRTITRFVGTVCIALVLEALIMIIKYSQLDLAGNLYYPVAILVGAGVLLISLGGFLALTRGQRE